MHSIVTLTLSPCIDKSTTVPSLIPDAKLKCTHPKLEPGGGGINVARALHKLGIQAVAVFPSGGYTGKFFNHLLDKEGISSIIIESSNETRENFIVLEEATGKQYRFGMPGTGLHDIEWNLCLRSIEETPDVEFIVASGSLPPGVPDDIYRQLSKISKSKNAKLVVDTAGEALKHAAEEGVYLLKPNLNELGYLTGETFIDIKNIEPVVKELQAQYPVEIWVVSMGSEGALLAAKNEMFKVTPPQVKRKSTVGAGDSMVAGIVYSLSKKMSLQQALQYGVACGTAATVNPGTELCKKEDADYLFSLISK